MSAIILICGDLFDGVSETLSGHTGILIEGEKIGKIAPSVGRPMGAEVIDLSDHTVSPGFIDTRVHPESLPDIVAMRGDPMADIRATAKVDFVMRGGAVYRAPEERLPN